MNFLLDAHLPRRVAVRLRERGHDVIHTLDLPRANRTTDREINDLSVRELRVVVGNIRKRELEALLLENLETILEGLAMHTYLELSRSAVILHF